MPEPVWISLAQIAKLALVAAGAGAGPFLLLASPAWLHRWLLLPLLINCGLGLIALTGLYAIYGEQKVLVAVPWAMAVSGGCVLLAMLGRWRRLKAAAVAFRPRWSDLGIFGLLLGAALVAVWPGIRAGGSQPYRVGVDEVGYAVSAQYLREGGTRESLSAALQAQTGQPTRAEAIQANLTALDFNVNTAGEFILKSQRSGYAGLVASILAATGVSQVISSQWLLLFFPSWLFLALTAVFLREDLALSLPASLLWTLALGLNCNLLNVLCEGQHAQVFTMPFTGIVLILWWRWRQAGQAGAGWSAMRGEGFGLGLFAFAVIAGTYSEQLVLLGGVGVLMCLADLALRRGQINRGNWLVVSATLGGLLLTGRYALEWVPFIVRHVTNVAQGGGGFWQPQWAVITDILGYHDIYAPATSEFIGRTWWSALFFGGISLAVLEFTLWRLWRTPARDPAFWLAPLTLVALVFAKSFFWDRIHNYNFMKTYTMLLLPLLALHAWTFTTACESAAGKWIGSWGGNLVRRLPLLLPAWIALIGIHYLHSYQNESVTLPFGARALAAPAIRERIQNSGLVLYGGGSFENLLMSGYADLPLLNLAWADPYLPPHEGKKILLLALKRNLLHPQGFAARNGWTVVFENNDVLLLDTGERLQVPPAQRNTAGLKPLAGSNPLKPRWPRTPNPQWAHLTENLIQ